MKTSLMKIVILSLIFGLVSAKNIEKPGEPRSKYPDPYIELYVC